MIAVADFAMVMAYPDDATVPAAAMVLLVPRDATGKRVDKVWDRSACAPRAATR